MVSVYGAMTHERKVRIWEMRRLGRPMSEIARDIEKPPATDMAVYFCDPSSPWQRGTNEKTNGLLRQYFPKGSILAMYTQKQLDAIAAKLNARPRKTLGFKTPAQVFNEALH